MTGALARVHAGRRAGFPSPGDWPVLGPSLERAGLSSRQSLQLLSGPVAAAPLGVALGVLWGPVAGLALVAALTATPLVLLVRWRHHGRTRIVAELPAALDHLARALRTGSSPRHAIERVAANGAGPVDRRLERVAFALRFGSDPDRAAAAFSQEGDPRVLARVAVVLAVALRDAGGAADAIDGVAATIRRDEAIRQQARALTAQARLSAKVLGALPAAFVALGALVGGDQMRPLFSTTTGRVSATVGAVLLAVGFGWMHLFIRRVDR